jgi:hypothetical protein
MENGKIVEPYHDLKKQSVGQTSFFSFSIYLWPAPICIWNQGIMSMIRKLMCIFVVS